MAQSLSHPEERTGQAPDNHDPLRHVPGTMDVSDHERVFQGFMTLVTRVAIAIVVALVLLALING